MKTYTLEELKLAQAKGCRIEYCDVDDGDWFVLGGDFAEKMSKAAAYKFRIHPADEWKARLPRLRDGAEWHRDDFTNEMLEDGYRPLLEGEACEHGDEVRLPLSHRWSDSGLDFGARMTSRHLHTRTRRPVPPEFLHPDELAKQPEAAQAPDFGEPWQPSCEMIFDRDGDYVAEFQPPFHDSSKVAARAIACVNALRGVPNPAEFVRQAKGNAEILKRLGHH
jgi:hypothetical protein